MIIKSIRIQNLKNMTIIFENIKAKLPKKSIKTTQKILTRDKNISSIKVYNKKLIGKLVENEEL